MKIDEFVIANAGKINKRFYPKYHFSTPIGWINDPNGFSYAFGRIHLFCQFYPYATNWGHINWGHAVSEDFVKWQWLPVALKPDKSYEEGIGIMSGTATEDGGNLLVCYASGSKINDVEKQQISLALSKNG